MQCEMGGNVSAQHDDGCHDDGGPDIGRYAGSFLSQMEIRHLVCGIPKESFAKLSG